MSVHEAEGRRDARVKGCGRPGVCYSPLVSSSARSTVQGLQHRSVFPSCFCHVPFSSPDLVGAAPANVRWTCLMLDLHYILSMYLNRRYSHLKSIKLCSNLLVRNVCTSDLVFDPGEELRLWGGVLVI